MGVKIEDKKKLLMMLEIEVKERGDWKIESLYCHFSGVFLREIRKE